MPPVRKKGRGKRKAADITQASTEAGETGAVVAVEPPAGGVVEKHMHINADYYADIQKAKDIILQDPTTQGVENSTPVDRGGIGAFMASKLFAGGG